MDINLSSQIVVQTAAQWAADNTVYSAKRILVTSDAYYGSTDQRKFKIADGVQTWSNLDYMPISQTLAQVLANGKKTNDLPIESNNAKAQTYITDTSLYLNWTSVSATNQLLLQDSVAALTFFDIGTGKYGSAGVNSDRAIIQHSHEVHLDAPLIKLSQGTASKLLKTDASKNITYVDEGLSLSGNNANQDIDIGSYSLNAKSLGIKGTGGAGHLGLKHQSANITASASESSLGANSSGEPIWKNDGNAIQEFLLKDSVNTATNYTTPLDADKVSIWDTANSLLKAVTWSNIKSTLKTYFDTVYKATFTENTAFNKNFGTGTTNIVEIGSTLGNSLITSTDANGKLQTLATSTYPSLTELSYVKGVTSAVQTQIDSKQNKGSSVVLQGTNTNLAQNTTYYLSLWSISITTSSSSRSYKFDRVSTIKSVQFVWINNNAVVTENATLYLRNNTAGTETSIGSINFSLGANALNNYVFTGLSISVPNTTDVWLVKIVTPATYATAPTGVYAWCKVFYEN